MKIGLGTAAIGRPHYINIRPEQSADAAFDKAQFINDGIKMLSEAYKQGIRHFDTAPGYGIAEQIILDWIEQEKPQDITISTKWGYTYVANFMLDAPKHEVKEHSLAKLNEQWDFSKKLHPYLNIYQIHSATLESGVLENVEIHNRLFELKQNNNIEIGLSVSGDNQNEIITKALQIEVNGQQLFDSFQITYNIFDQSLLQILHLLKDKKIIVKEALANGRIFPNNAYPNYQKNFELLNLLAQKYAVGVDAIALQFCIDTLSPFSVLSGASHPYQLASNIKANNFKLSKEEINQIKNLSITPHFYWKERKKLIWN